MKADLLPLLSCPSCQTDLDIQSKVSDGDDIVEGSLYCCTCQHQFPITNHIPRFTAPENYAMTFDIQWATFRTVQIDRFNGHTFSRDRFYYETQWDPSSLKGARILDAGCGTGRFSHIALDAGADVIACDLSTAIDACRTNFPTEPHLHLLQADMEHLPLKLNLFDGIFCFGVLQHTPNPERTFHSLLPHLKPGGRIVADVYISPSTKVNRAKYRLRPLTTRLPKRLLLWICKTFVPLLLPILYTLESRSKWIKRVLQLLPIPTYHWIPSLTPEERTIWSVMNTYDLLTPTHDHPQTLAAVQAWGHTPLLKNFSIESPGLLILRAERNGPPGSLRHHAPPPPHPPFV